MFDCGTVSHAGLAGVRLQESEIEDHRLAELDEALELLSGPLRRRLSQCAGSDRLRLFGERPPSSGRGVKHCRGVSGRNGHPRRRRLRPERAQLFVPPTDHPVGPLGHLVPSSGKVTDGLGDHESRVVGDLEQDLPVRSELADRLEVATVEQRPRLALAGVAEHPNTLAVGSCDRALERELDALAATDILDQPDRPRDGVRRIALEAEGQREVEQNLGVRRTGDLGEKRFVDCQQEVAPDPCEVGDVSVVHEQPAAVSERMAVGLLDRRPDRRPNVREEVPGRDMRRELPEILVVPGGLDAVKHTRGRLIVIPADPEPVAVGRLGAEFGVQALVDQRMNRRIQRRLQQDG